MFETAVIHTRVASDGRVHIDYPVSLPPDSEVRITIVSRPRIKFANEAEWQAHVDRIAGSIPDLEVPDQLDLRDVEPL